MPDHALFDFSGGWVTSRPPVLLADNELELADNVRLFPGGGFGLRPGYRRLANNDSDTSLITGVKPFATATGTKHVVRVKNYAAGRKIEYDNVGTWTDITGAVTVSAGNIKHVFDVFRGYVVGTNGTDVPWKWPGTGNAAAITRAIAGGADTIDKCVALCVHRERLILGDVTATETAVQTRYESVVWPSDAGTLDTWSATPTGKIHLGQGDGDSITAMVSILGYLVVAKQNSLWRISDYGVTDTQVAIKVANVGTPSKHGMCMADGRVWFFTADAILYSYDPRQGDSPDALVDHTTPKLGRRTTSRLGAVGLTGAHMTYNALGKELVWFNSDPDGGSQSPGEDVAWVYNIALSAWSRWYFTGRQVNVSAYGFRTSNITGEPVLHYGTSDGFVMVANRDDAKDDATGTPANITATAYLAPTSCGSPGAFKWWKWAYLYTNSRTPGDSTVPTARSVSLYHDEVLPATGTVSTTHALTMPAQSGATSDMYDSVAEARLTGYGKFIRFRIAHTTESNADHLRVSGILLNYEPTGPRR